MSVPGRSDNNRRLVSVSLWRQNLLAVHTSGRGTVDITGEVSDSVQGSGITTGLCHIFIKHTSASLMLCENADPDVQRDLETWMSRNVVDGDSEFVHTSEGPDDMSAHIRTMLTGSDLTIPVTASRLALGTWQGIYVWEHRARSHSREVVVTIQGI